MDDSLDVVSLKKTRNDFWLLPLISAVSSVSFSLQHQTILWLSQDSHWEIFWAAYQPLLSPVILSPCPRRVPAPYSAYIACATHGGCQSSFRVLFTQSWIQSARSPHEDGFSQRETRYIRLHTVDGVKRSPAASYSPKTGLLASAI